MRVVDPDERTPADPMVVGAAADMSRRRPRSLFRGHRSGDTGELEPVPAEIPGVGYAIPEDPIVDPEALRYAPQPPPRFAWARRLLGAAIVLGLVGGFLDAAGGGGWGAIVTSNLLVQGSNPRKTIGTVNTAEFFLTITISATFIAALGWKAFTVATLGLLIGGVVAAPFGAFIAKKVNPDTLLTFVGALVTLTSGYGLYRALT